MKILDNGMANIEKRLEDEQVHTHYLRKRSWQHETNQNQ